MALCSDFRRRTSPIVVAKLLYPSAARGLFQSSSSSSTLYKICFHLGKIRPIFKKSKLHLKKLGLTLQVIDVKLTRVMDVPEDAKITTLEYIYIACPINSPGGFKWLVDNESLKDEVLYLTTSSYFIENAEERVIEIIRTFFRSPLL